MHIVGESGSGKSVIMLSLLRLLGTSGRVVGGSIVFDGTELTEVPERRMADLTSTDQSWVMRAACAEVEPNQLFGKGTPSRTRTPNTREHGQEDKTFPCLLAVHYPQEAPGYLPAAHASGYPVALLITSPIRKPLLHP